MVRGENLASGDETSSTYPTATLGGRRVPVRASTDSRPLCVAVPHGHGASLEDEPLNVVLDPDAAITMRLRVQPGTHVARGALHV